MPFPYNINNIISRAKTDPKGFAHECEAIYNRKIAEVAATIMEKLTAVQNNTVLLSGPSASGKTTTAKKICDSLEKLGVKSHSISLDKYYLPIDPETVPRTANGEVDRESPYCLDLDMLNKHLHDLNLGKEVIIPHFSFTNQVRDPKREMRLKLGADEIVVFEGIHALNDLLTNKHPEAFKLYISALSHIIRDDDEICFYRHWVRLIRRIVRDNNFRGTDPTKTLKIWATVREGENKYILPFKHKADLQFDSSMEYELAVMKKFALKAIDMLPEDDRNAGELQAILPVLNELWDIDDSLVLGDSIIREFIGGGTYAY